MCGRPSAVHRLCEARFRNGGGTSGPSRAGAVGFAPASVVGKVGRSMAVVLVVARGRVVSGGESASTSGTRLARRDWRFALRSPWGGEGRPCAWRASKKRPEPASRPSAPACDGTGGRSALPVRGRARSGQRGRGRQGRPYPRTGAYIGRAGAQDCPGGPAPGRAAGRPRRGRGGLWRGLRSARGDVTVAAIGAERGGSPGGATESAGPDGVAAAVALPVWSLRLHPGCWRMRARPTLDGACNVPAAGCAVGEGAGSVWGRSWTPSRHGKRKRRRSALWPGCGRAGGRPPASLAERPGCGLLAGAGPSSIRAWRPVERWRVWRTGPERTSEKVSWPSWAVAVAVARQRDQACFHRPARDEAGGRARAPAAAWPATGSVRGWRGSSAPAIGSRGAWHEG